MGWRWHNSQTGGFNLKLVCVQIRSFRNILNSTEVEIQDDVTCLVGKNESGKTAFLEALRCLKPAQGSPKYELGRHYPAWLEKKHRQQGKNLDDVRAVTAWFSLEQTDKDYLFKRLGEGVFNSDKISVNRSYGGVQDFNYSADESRAVINLIDIEGLSSSIVNDIGKPESFKLLKDKVTELQAREDDEAQDTAKKLHTKIDNYLGKKENFSELILSVLSQLVPNFFYFAEYSKLPGIVKIRKLLETSDEELGDGERTAKSLLMQAGAEDDYLLNPDYEPRKRELENVANAITEDVLKYWTTNQELRVEIDISMKTVDIPNGQHAVQDELHVRMRDDRHMLSLPFEERSSGFQWFFSFLSAFSEYEYNNEPVVILLDEPGVGLHARAQADFLRFIDERLAQRCQVIYTTHSPFMIQPGKLERVRIVEDRGRDHGVVISADVLTTDSDTLFPLQHALGYDLAQHLFIGPDNLVVEGTSDLIYLSALSRYLAEEGRVSLDERWTITPVGGADLLPTFVALLGRKKLDFTVLVDSRKEGHQKLHSLVKKGFLAKSRIITIGQVIDQIQGDIEDLFKLDDYLNLYNRAFNKKLKSSALSGTGPLVKRIARKENLDRFDHGKPADVLLRHRDEILPNLSEDSLKNFETIFSEINATLPTN